MLLKVALLVELADGVSKEELHAATDATIIGRKSRGRADQLPSARPRSVEYLCRNFRLDTFESSKARL
jgi:hypothetical protein